MAVLYGANTLHRVTICYVMWFVTPLHEFDVLLWGLVLRHETLLLRYVNWSLRFVYLSFAMCVCYYAG